MLDPYAQTVTFVLFALMIGVVIFGGTTLAYFLGKRRSHPHALRPAQPLHERSKAAVTGASMDAAHDEAA